MLDDICKLHGCPATIVTDRDVVFLSNFWTEFMRLQGVQLAMSTAYHPQSNGQTEILNRCLEGYLRRMCIDTPLTWVKWLSLAQWWYNATWHSAIKMTPHDALYGVKPNIHIPFIPDDTTMKVVEALYKDRVIMHRKLKSNLQVAGNRMKQQADNHITGRQFQEGDWVYVKLHHFYKTSLKKHHNRKLSPKYFGPFEVLEKIGEVAYKLNLLSDAQIHHTFQVKK